MIFCKQKENKHKCVIEFPVHHDCLLDAMTYLCYNDLIREKVVCVSMAIVLGFEEFIDGRAQTILDQFQMKEEDKLKSKIQDIVVCEYWNNVNPLLESVDEMKRKLDLRCLEKKNFFDRASLNEIVGNSFWELGNVLRSGVTK